MDVVTSQEWFDIARDCQLKAKAIYENPNATAEDLEQAERLLAEAQAAADRGESLKSIMVNATGSVESVAAPAAPQDRT